MADNLQVKKGDIVLVKCVVESEGSVDYKLPPRLKVFGGYVDFYASDEGIDRIVSYAFKKGDWLRYGGFDGDNIAQVVLVDGEQIVVRVETGKLTVIPQSLARRADALADDSADAPLVEAIAEAAE